MNITFATEFNMIPRGHFTVQFIIIVILNKQVIHIQNQQFRVRRRIRRRRGMCGLGGRVAVLKVSLSSATRLKFKKTGEALSVKASLGEFLSTPLADC